MPRKPPGLAQAPMCAGLFLAEGSFEPLLSSFRSAGRGVDGAQEPTSFPLSFLDLGSLPARISHFRLTFTIMQDPFLHWTTDPQNQSSTRPRLKTI